VGFSATDGGLGRLTALGWFSRLTYNQATQASVIAKFMGALGWSRPILLRQAWAESFKNELSLLGKPAGSDVTFLCGKYTIVGKDAKCSGMFADSFGTPDRLNMKEAAVASRSNLFIVWSHLWMSHLSIARQLNMVGQGTAWIMLDTQAPPANQLGCSACPAKWQLQDMQGAFSVMDNRKTAGEYSKWETAQPWHDPAEGFSMSNGVAYESVLLFAQALDVAVKAGKTIADPNNALFISDMVRNGTFNGPVHPNGKLSAVGEINADYVLFNFVNQSWRPVGLWYYVGHDKYRLALNFGNETTTVMQNGTAVKVTGGMKSVWSVDGGTTHLWPLKFRSGTSTVLYCLSVCLLINLTPTQTALH